MARRYTDAEIFIRNWWGALATSILFLITINHSLLGAGGLLFLGGCWYTFSPQYLKFYNLDLSKVHDLLSHISQETQDEHYWKLHLSQQGTTNRIQISETYSDRFKWKNQEREKGIAFAVSIKIKKPETIKHLLEQKNIDYHFITGTIIAGYKKYNSSNMIDTHTLNEIVNKTLFQNEQNLGTLRVRGLNNDSLYRKLIDLTSNRNVI